MSPSNLPLLPTERRMTLGELFSDDTSLSRSRSPGEPAALSANLAAVCVRGLSLDSRLVEPGDLYLALPGRQTHGFLHAAQAVERGAVAIACEADALASHDGPLPDVPTIGIERLLERVNALASRFHDAPDAALHLVAVTGTDGKTSVCRFVAEAFAAGGVMAGYIGTLGWGLVGADAESLGPTALTTPDAVVLRRMLAALRDAGASVVALEASSHGLAEGRLDGLAIDVAVLTNLGRDHLDYHGTLERYAAAKARLFDWPSLGGIVVNADDALGRKLVTRTAARGDSVRIVSFSMADAVPPDTEDTAHTADRGCELALRAVAVTPGTRGIDFRLEQSGGAGQAGNADGDATAFVSSPLIGRFNVQNLLACAGVLRLAGVALDQVARRIAALRPVPGRMERFGGEAAPLVIVDYAHTPQALAAALNAARAHCVGELWVVFGCGGDRDPGKRAPMGQAAAAADRILVTDDNPRREASAAIIDAILDGIPSRDSVIVIADRTAAIERALTDATARDVVLVAGKGHEDYQIIGTERIDYSDRETVSRLLGATRGTPHASVPAGVGA